MWPRNASIWLFNKLRGQFNISQKITIYIYILLNVKFKIGQMDTKKLNFDRYVALLWALPTSQTTLTLGLD